MPQSKDLVASIFEAGSDYSKTLSKAVSDPTLSSALRVGSGIAKVVATLIQSLGVEGTRDAIAELVARKNEGVISNDDLSDDDKAIFAAVSEMFNDVDPDTDEVETGEG